MHELIKYFNMHNFHDASITSKKQALLLFIFKFLCIHPFANANGRVASILLDSGLIYLGYTPMRYKEKYDAEKFFALNIQKSIRENSFEKFLFAFNDLSSSP